MEWINLPWIQGGAVVVLLAGIWLIFTGRLLPKSYVDTLREGDRLTIERQREEITEWRQAWLMADRTKRELVAQVGELKETSKITEHILTTIAGDST